ASAGAARYFKMAARQIAGARMALLRGSQGAGATRMYSAPASTKKTGQLGLTGESSHWDKNARGGLSRDHYVNGFRKAAGFADLFLVAHAAPFGQFSFRRANTA